MQPNQMMQLIDECIKRLQLIYDNKTKKRLQEILQENTPDERKFRRAISKVEKMHESDKRNIYEAIENAYQNERESYVSVECDYCRGAGMVQVIQLSGVHNGREKVWIYNFKKSTKQDKFLQINKTFTAQTMKFPCMCENGNLRNRKGEDQDWLSAEQRRAVAGKAYIAKFGTPEEMTDEENYINYQMMNRINGFKKGLDLPVYGVDKKRSLDDLKMDFRKVMEGWH